MGTFYKMKHFFHFCILSLFIELSHSIKTLDGYLGEDVSLKGVCSHTGLVDDLKTNNETVGWFKHDVEFSCPSGIQHNDPLDNALLWAYYRNDEDKLDDERHYVDNEAFNRGIAISSDL